MQLKKIRMGGVVDSSPHIKLLSPMQHPRSVTTSYYMSRPSGWRASLGICLLLKIFLLFTHPVTSFQAVIPLHFIKKDHYLHLTFCSPSTGLLSSIGTPTPSPLPQINPITPIQFTVLGEPQPLVRHRSTRFGHVYNPSGADQKLFLQKSLSFLPHQPLTDPLRLEVSFFFARPKAHYRSGKHAHILREDSPIWCTNRKDLDNLVKFVMDALNGHAYVDDRQVVVIQAAKLFIGRDELARTEVKLTSMV